MVRVRAGNPDGGIIVAWPLAVTMHRYRLWVLPVVAGTVHHRKNLASAISG
jgi:hypothetical protein